MEPIVIKDWRKIFLFGLCRIHYIIEDRIPDCNSVNADRYKHYLTVYICRKSYSWVFRTEYEYDNLPFGDVK